MILSGDQGKALDEILGGSEKTLLIEGREKQRLMYVICSCAIEELNLIKVN